MEQLDYCRSGYNSSAENHNITIAIQESNLSSYSLAFMGIKTDPQLNKE